MCGLQANGFTPGRSVLKVSSAFAPRPPVLRVVQVAHKVCKVSRVTSEVGDQSEGRRLSRCVLVAFLPFVLHAFVRLFSSYLSALASIPSILFFLILSFRISSWFYPWILNFYPPLHSCLLSLSISITLHISSPLPTLISVHFYINHHTHSFLLSLLSSPRFPSTSFLSQEISRKPQVRGRRILCLGWPGKARRAGGGWERPRSKIPVCRVTFLIFFILSQQFGCSWREKIHWVGYLYKSTHMRIHDTV